MDENGEVGVANPDAEARIAAIEGQYRKEPERTSVTVPLADLRTASDNLKTRLDEAHPSVSTGEFPTVSPASLPNTAEAKLLERIREKIDSVKEGTDQIEVELSDTERELLKRYSNNQDNGNGLTGQEVDARLRAADDSAANAVSRGDEALANLRGLGLTAEGNPSPSQPQSALDRILSRFKRNK